MSYPSVGIGGSIHPCYYFVKNLQECFSRQLFPQTNCQMYKKDFLQCHHRQSKNVLMEQASRQMKKLKAINVPTYDKDGDRFVFDDGRVVSNSDPIFDKFKWA